MNAEQQATPVALGPVRELIARLCRLQEQVCAEAIGYSHANDCICGEGGFWGGSDVVWPDAPPYWRNSAKAIEFIETAVAEKIQRDRAANEFWRYL